MPHHDAIERGFCRTCNRNAPFARPKNALWLSGILNWLPLERIGIGPLGPWVCECCSNKMIFLRRPRPHAPEFVSKIDHAIQLAEQVEAETIGNFLVTEKSLIHRANRLARFSEKYRDSVVRKILTGSTTIRRVRDELNLSEPEVLDWVADLVRRLNEDLGNLRDELESIQSPQYLNSPQDANPRVPR